MIERERNREREREKLDELVFMHHVLYVHAII